MNDLKRVFVTGATGYIGGHLIPCLLEEGYQVRAFIRNPQKLEKYDWRKKIQISVGDVFSPETLEPIHRLIFTKIINNLAIKSEQT